MAYRNTIGLSNVEALELKQPPISGVLDKSLELLTAGISKRDPSTSKEPHRIVMM